ncbi:tumor necrosis factor receptor superfamily member 16-like [Patiria miniata]|uniref:TNFR-Cys domain-containing protein n=1 Tax=Patiria miniata TaxID=46514 RepID=A0A913YXR3_PATMI|nr:tumor necrosis factor receptor superfamily member 16-like [Patiria miniata]
MPRFQYSLFCLVLLGFILHANALKLAERAADDEPHPYCILGPDQEGVSKFQLGPGGTEYRICRRGHFFNFNPGPLGPIGCTTCPRNTHYMDSRNYCPQCKQCTVCGDNEKEIVSCTPYRNRICEPTIIIPSNVTVENQYDFTTMDSTTALADATLTSTTPPTCPPCVSRAPTNNSSSTTSVTRKEDELTQQNQCIDQNIVIVSTFCGVFGLIAVIEFVLILYCKRRKKQEGNNPNNGPADAYRRVPPGDICLQNL